MPQEKKHVLMISSGVTEITPIPSPTFLAIKRAVSHEGGEPVMLDYSDVLLRKSSFNVEFVGNTMKATLKINRRIYDFKDDIHSIIMWHPNFPDLYMEKKIGYEEWLFLRAEWQSFLEGLWLCLKEKFWLNPYPATKIHDAEKCFQLKIAQSLGLNIPPTFITTSIKDAETYFKDCQEDIIYKPFTRFSYAKRDKLAGEDTYYSIGTNFVNKEEFEKPEPPLATPNIFQKFTSKYVEIRTIVIVDNVFSIELHPPEDRKGKIDWRSTEFPKLNPKRHTLPDEIKDKCVRIVKELGLRYAALDLILAPQGEYVFLEANASGEYYLMEYYKLVGTNEISNKIATLLLSG